jgi:hypothetical protein
MILDGRPLSARERRDLVLEVVRLRWREEQGQSAAARVRPLRAPTTGERGTGE